MATALGSYATGSAIKSRAGITDSTDDTLIATIADQVNSYIEGVTGRILAPITGTATLIWDGNGENRLYLPTTNDATYPYIGGLRSISKLELQLYTGAGYETLAAGDYYLRHQSQPGAPFDWLYLSDRPTGSYYTFPKGFATVRITSVGHRLVGHPRRDHRRRADDRRPRLARPRERPAGHRRDRRDGPDDGQPLRLGP